MGKRKGKKTRSLEELELTKSRVRKITCSEAWTEAVVHQHAIYPPPADTTPMQLCHVCHAFYPHYYVSDLRCEDCKIARMKPEFADQLPSSNFKGLLNHANK